jgi:hypothetical protein
MGYDNLLYVSSDVDAKQTLEFFLEGIGIDTKPHLRLDKHPVAVANWLGCVVYAQELSELSRSFIKQHLNIDPSVKITFSLQKSGDLARVEVDILKGTLEFVRKTAWDLALTHGDSFVVILRQSGKLLLKKDYGFWTSEHLKVVNVPYTMEAIPKL